MYETMTNNNNNNTLKVGFILLFFSLVELAICLVDGSNAGTPCPFLCLPFLQREHPKNSLVDVAHFLRIQHPLSQFPSYMYVALWSFCEREQTPIYVRSKVHSRRAAAFQPHNFINVQVLPSWGNWCRQKGCGTEEASIGVTGAVCCSMGVAGAGIGPVDSAAGNHGR